MKDSVSNVVVEGAAPEGGRVRALRRGAFRPATGRTPPGERWGAVAPGRARASSQTPLPIPLLLRGTDHARR